ncbi:FkbM family methyltransferase [Spirosoma validum]|uniref:FkbM family methyltransferase n=1 Tax=Spirosoma validum TaxID=2771355 RepID=A0A927AZM4_9BACT|nr:FkbM family methyltransferase [Spirosoma validum]MBD2752577.1 FkbM family methyltransferase [Spirosoma validum]
MATFFLRVLKKVGLLKYVTVNFPIVFNQKKITIPLRKEIGYPNVFIEEDFLLKLMHLFLPAKPGVFVDVGVNIGQTLLKIKTVDRDRKYIGFEPNGVCVDYTTDLIRLNKYSHCEVRNYALSDRNKRAKLALNELTDASASIIANLRPDYFKDSILIDCISFDESGITEPVSIIKIDVEGAELEVITGMQQAIDAFHPLIVCEVLDCYSAEVLDFTQKRADCLCRLLNKHDYIIFQLHQDKKRIRKFERVESINISLWSPASYKLNDYLFCHAEFEQSMIGLLNQLASV